MQKTIFNTSLLVMAGVLFLTLGTMIMTVNAAEITLAWDDPQNPDYGTMILVGTEAGNYQWKHDAGIGTTQTVVSNLMSGTTYHFAAIHYHDGIESGLSNSVVASMNQWSDLPDLPALPNQPPVAQNLLER